MATLRRCPVSRLVAKVLIVAFILPLVGFYGVRPAVGQEEIQFNKIAVLPFENLSRYGTEELGQRAADAVAMTLKRSREVLVVKQDEVQSALRSLNFSLPLRSKEQLQLLGQTLEVDGVLVGRVVKCKVDQPRGRALVELQMEMLDVVTGEYLNGAWVERQTPEKPGYTGTEDTLVTDAVNLAAQDAVDQMMALKVRTGSVMQVDLTGDVMIDIGRDKGMSEGREMVLMRPEWVPEREKMVFRKLGKVRITEAGARSSICRAEPGTPLPRTTDRVVAIYQMPGKRVAVAKKKSMKQIVRSVLALGLLWGVISIASSGNPQSSPNAFQPRLVQQRPGDLTAIRVTWPVSSIPDVSRVLGYVIYRSHGTSIGLGQYPATTPEFNPTPENIVQVVQGGERTVWDDAPTSIPAPYTTQTVELTKTIVDLSGNEQDLSFSATWTVIPVVEGETYFYRVARVAEHFAGPTGNIPGTTTGGTTSGTTTSTSRGMLMARQQQQQDQQEQTYEFEISDDGGLLSAPSDPLGPVTYILPPMPQDPANGADNQEADRVRFVWEPAAGANEYRVEVFTNPNTTGTPIFASPTQVVTNPAQQAVSFDWVGANLQGQQTYYWRVGARRSGERLPLLLSTNSEGWIYSPIYSFRTAEVPPPPPSR